MPCFGDALGCFGDWVKKLIGFIAVLVYCRMLRKLCTDHDEKLT